MECAVALQSLTMKQLVSALAADQGQQEVIWGTPKEG